MKAQPTMSFKIQYKNECKKIKIPDNFEQLMSYTTRAFEGLDLPPKFKFYYLDSDGDMISLSCQEDFTEAIDSMDGTIKLIIEESLESAKISIDLDQSFRQEMRAYQMPLQMSGGLNVGTSQLSVAMPESPLYVNTSIQHDNEGMNVAIGTHMVTQESATETCNIRQAQESVSCGTNAVQTAEKNLGGFVNTQNVALQSINEQKDVQMQENVQTSSFGSQIGAIVPDREASCQVNTTNENIEVGQPDANIPCFRCDGSGKNKKGNKCLKCQGQGILSNSFYVKVVDMVREEIRNSCKVSFREMLTEFKKERAQLQKETIHSGFTCDGCNTLPIQGIRYKCSICEDFDLCENCEARNIHSEHAFVKIRDPSKAPKFMYTSNQQVLSGPGSIFFQTDSSSKCQFSSQQSKPNLKKLRADFVSESLKDGAQFAPGATIIKTWTLRNSGQEDWPESTFLVKSSGQDIDYAIISNQLGSVKPGEQIDLTIDITAPKVLGKYNTFFRLQFGEDCVKFGQQIWIEFEVIELIEQKMEDLKISQSEGSSLAQNIDEEEFSSLAEKVEEAPVDKVKEELSSQIEEKLSYDMQVSDAAQEYQENLMKMFELGLTNFQVNLNTLKRCKNNVQQAVNKIINGEIGMSIFQE